MVPFRLPGRPIDARLRPTWKGWALGAAMLAGLLLPGWAAAAQTGGAAAPDAFAQARGLGRGLNVLGYDPLWTDPARARFKDRHFDAIKAAGFSTLRVNLQAFSHMDADNRLDPRWLATLDRVVSSAQRRGLAVILDEHNYNECGKDPVGCRPKLLAFWRQIGDRYRDAPPSVLFELLNEPNTGLTPEAWNALLGEALATVRRSNPTRTVVVGPAFWNNISNLQFLKLPAQDRNIIVTVHYYLPMEFTHQGAAWNPDTAKLSGVTWGSDADRARLDRDLDLVQEWSRANRRPILLGEFGAYDAGEMASRVRYTAAVARGAEARGWAWTYWQFDSDFIAYDMARDDWVRPILDALVPAKAAGGSPPAR